MSVSRIKAILIQELFITIRSTEVIFDMAVFPLTSVVLFAFLSQYLSASNPDIANNVLMGIVLWQLIYIAQYSICLGTLWNLWARNLSNMFITPISISEYLIAYAISGICKATIILLICSVALYYIFGFDILGVGILNLIFYFVSLMLFAFSVGIIILGLIFRYGSRINAFAWGILPLFQPLTGSLFPVSILPVPLQYVAYTLPPTHIFEAARISMMNGSIQWSLLAISLLENIVYLVLALIFFNAMFKKSKETGQFARNET